MLHVSKMIIEIDECICLLMFFIQNLKMTIIQQNVYLCPKQLFFQIKLMLKVICLNISPFLKQYERIIYENGKTIVMSGNSNF